jgi:hypothetical protein
MSTETLLNEREKTHGPYSLKARIIQRMKEVMRDNTNWDRLSDTQRESLDMIVHKIGRILSGDANHADHWDDIAGYAKLIPRDLAPAVRLCEAGCGALWEKPVPENSHWVTVCCKQVVASCCGDI